MTQPFRLSLCVLALLLIGDVPALAQTCPSVVWSDEFDGSSLDAAKWTHQLGDGCSINLCGWGNNELQWYQEENATVGGGLLRITARKERVRNRKYTSSRIRTLDKGDWTFGRFEARIKLTQGQGIWPAFWMMPTDEIYGWPTDGEIDIMENVGHEPRTVHGTMHFGDAWPNNRSSGASFSLHPDEPVFADGFHTFAVEREPGVIRWFVDDILYSTKTTADTEGYIWPFDERFHFILNVAVGGNWPGDPDNTTVFPQVLEVDYVRVYDGPAPHLTGARLVANQAAGVGYSVGNAPSGSSFTWSVPAGAVIASGQGTPDATVDWGDAGGDVTVEVASACGTQTLRMNVVVEPPFDRAFSFENFDEPANATVGGATSGTLTEVANPDPAPPNTSALSGRYVRNAGVQWDVLFYDTAAIPDAAPYTANEKKFYLDVYTAAPVGTEILLQLENQASASANPYPTGRHSRFRAYTTVQNQWERLAFAYLDAPDPGTADTDIDQIALLFAPDSFTDDAYTIDNFDSYAAGSGSGSPPAAPTGLGATAVSSSQIDLAWTDNASDEDEFRIERSTEGGPFAEIATVPADATAYTNTGLTASTSYTYRVRAVNAAGPSAYSNTASATTSGGGAATTLSVASVATGTQSAGKGQKQGTATVVVRDDQGNPVGGATVVGTFSGSFTETASAVTAADGQATVVTTATAKGNVSVGFCVDDVTHATLLYDAGGNTQTCAGASKRGADGRVPADAFLLAPNHPNPFTGATHLSFTLAHDAPVRLSVFDALGREVRRLVDAPRAAGTHRVVFEAGGLPAGVYLARLTAGGQHLHRRMLLTR